MPNPDKNDPEFLPMGRPRCPQCQTRMITSALSEEPEGFERRTFECLKCGHCEQKVVTVGPMTSHTVAWSNGELKAADKSIKPHDIHDGRMVLKRDK
jgi:Zn ribbon nucleic-acid-binding protein